MLPNLSWHQGLLSWETIFLQTREREGWFGDSSSSVFLLYTSFLFVCFCCTLLISFFWNIHNYHLDIILNELVISKLSYVLFIYKLIYLSMTSKVKLLGKVCKKFFFNFYTHIHIETVQFSCLAVSDSLQPHEPQHARPPCPSSTPGVYSNSCPLSR